MENPNDLSDETRTGEKAFRLIVITSPDFFDDEAVLLEGLLEKGLTKIHIRKPGAKEDEIGAFLSRLSPDSYSRLVLHGSRSLADKFGIPQIHCPLNVWKSNKNMPAMSYSTSLHSREEAKETGNNLVYAFMSPLFDSISKQGYKANAALWQGLPGDYSRPAGYQGAEKDLPLIGLGGINKELLPLVIRGGWDGAAVLGWIWEEPKLAIHRFVELQDVIGGFRITKEIIDK